MSNWAVVMVAWTAIDSEAESHSGSHRPRADDVIRAIRSTHPRSGGTIYVPPCPEDDSLGGACEVVVVAHVCHFGPDDLAESLRQLAWEYPDEVEILWKDEHADGYSVVKAFAKDAPHA